MFSLDKIMERLARRRSVFCSEADFQHEPAIELRMHDPLLKVRLEWPIDTSSRGAIDLVVIGHWRYAIEVKYLSKKLMTEVDGEVLHLKQHGASDQRRYDICKDLVRIEAFCSKENCEGGVLVLTNDPGYWRSRLRADHVDAAFQLEEGRSLHGVLEWGERATAGTKKNREKALSVQGHYDLHWRDYASLPLKSGLFRYLWIPVRNRFVSEPYLEGE